MLSVTPGSREDNESRSVNITKKHCMHETNNSMMITDQQNK
jgi:hypothetical protein